MPSALVVKKGVKSLSRTSSLRPRPWSVTANSTQTLRGGSSSPECRRDCPTDSVSTRRPEAVGGSPSGMACMPLRARLSSTCSTMVRSHSTGGQPGDTEVCTRMPSFLDCSVSSGMMASIRLSGATASRTCSRRRTKSATLLITRPARSACSLMRCMAWRRSLVGRP